MRFKAVILIIFSTATIFAQKGIELSLGAGVFRDHFKVLDGGQHIRPQFEDSNTISLLLRKGISKNFGLETGLSYKYFRGDYFNRIFHGRFNHLMIPLQVNGKFELSKKNKIYFVPTAAVFYLTKAIGSDSYASNEFENMLNWGPDTPIFSYTTNSSFNGNTVGVSGELALEFVIFSKLTFHLGYQYSTAFRNVYLNEIQYFAEGRDTFTATISSKNQYRGYNISFYYPIDGNQKN